MTLRGDERAVTVQIGAVLLFGILIIALATLQVTVVPNENSAAEFQQNLEAQQGMTDLRNALLAAGATGDPGSAAVPLGTTYKQRTLLINPGPASGTIQTIGTGDQRVNVTINHAGADSEYANAVDYWDGTPRTYDTGTIVYTPNYNEYREAPTTVYENSLVLNVFGENETLERTGQTLIQGNRINLLTINGSLQESGIDAETVDARPLSSYTNTVTVESTASDPLWVNITTRLTADTWRNRVLANQLSSNGGNVADVVEIGNSTRDGVTYHRVGIRLEPGSYELRGASVAVGAVSESNKQPDPTYFVVTDGYDTVGNGSTGTITVQVRDQFNNPVDDFEVNGTLDTEHLQFVNQSGAEVDTLNVTTDGDGYATFTYTAVNETGAGESAWLNVSMLDSGENYTYRNFTEREVPTFAGDGGGGDSVNPGSSGDVILSAASIETANNNNSDYIVLTINNTKADPVNLTYARIEFYYTPDNTAGYTEAAIANVSDPTNFYADADDPRAVMEIGGGYEDIRPKIRMTPGETDVTLEFRPPGGNQLERDEFFVITFVYEVGDETERYRYFVNPPG